MDHNKLELIATIHVKVNDELYKVVDFLNKNLKEKDIIFGLTKEEDSMCIKIYEV